MSRDLTERRRETDRILATLQSGPAVVFPQTVREDGVDRQNPCSIRNEAGELCSIVGRCTAFIGDQQEDFTARHDWGRPRIANKPEFTEDDIEIQIRYLNSVARAQRALEEDLRNRSQDWIRRQHPCTET